LHGVLSFDGKPPVVDVPSSNVTINTPSFPKAGDARIFGTSRARKSSNWLIGGPGRPGHWSCESSHMFGTMKLKSATSPLASAASSALVSFGPVPPVGMTLSRHRSDRSVEDHTPPTPSMLS
jgi:hypothetical protein